MKTFCVSYQHKGSEWGLQIIAEDSDDAKARLRALGFNGKVLGELMATIPASIGWWVPLVVWVRNVLGRKMSPPEQTVFETCAGLAAFACIAALLIAFVLGIAS